MSPAAEARLFDLLAAQGWTRAGDAAVAPNRQYWVVRADCAYWQVGALYERMGFELCRLERVELAYSGPQALQEAQADLRGLVAALEVLVSERLS